MDSSYQTEFAAESSRTQQPGPAAGRTTDSLATAVEFPVEGNPTADAAQHLARVVADVEQFLTHHVGRLTGVLQQAQANRQLEQELRREQDELERQRGNWKQQRQQEAAAIAEERERLVSCWKHLESEERRVAARAESILLDRDAGLVVDAATGTATAVVARPGAQTGPVAPVEEAPPPLRSIGRPQSGNSSNARLQFEHMRREIQNHARSRRAK